MKKAFLLNLGTNIFACKGADYPCDPEDVIYRDKLYFDIDTWDKIIDSLPSFGVDTVVISLAEGLCYNSHPELAVEGSLSVDWLRSQLSRLSSMGITAVPCLEIFPPHTAWLQAKGVMPGTELYLSVCTDLINEVVDLFDSPELFNIGVGEHYYVRKYVLEEAQPITVMFAPHILHRYVNAFSDVLRARGCRPWLWMDENTYAMLEGGIAKDTVLSVCYNEGIPIKIYVDKDGKLFSAADCNKTARLYKKLSDSGFCQIPAVTRRLHPRVPKRVMEYCTLECENIDGFIMIPESNVVERKYYSLMNSAQNLSVSYNAVFGKGGTLNV